MFPLKSRQLLLMVQPTQVIIHPLLISLDHVAKQSEDDSLTNKEQEEFVTKRVLGMLHV